MENILEKEQGITLVALVVTIVVLIILAGISISIVLGNNGIIGKAKEAKSVTNEDQYNTQVAMNTLEEDMNKYIGNSTDPKWNSTQKLCKPNLKTGMTPVKWDASNNESTTTEADASWYNYVAQASGVDQTSYWANTKTADGSYWVWIPRYEYKITPAPSGTASNTNAGTIDVKFIPISKTTADEGYIIHPAFTNDSANGFENGGWDSELAGIWVAKYEMSMETNGSHTETSSATIGNVLTSTAIKAVSKPNVSSWRYITIGNMYTNAYEYDRTKESHMMKNSEWGAVAYLTHSQYGRNEKTIYVNNSTSYITGNSGGSMDATGISGTANQYNTVNGVKASSTGNISGIYDLSGGAFEYVALFNDTDANGYEAQYANSFASTSKASTKYETKYSNSTKTQSGELINSVGKIRRCNKRSLGN